mmetsp:Transcript_14298/g.41711  ORF Transcript_14298/g.41711 Transcript_14298/m.41711 type:complete len:311 (+) Transcript_14298:824-1756(+)
MSGALSSPLGRNQTSSPSAGSSGMRLSSAESSSPEASAMSMRLCTRSLAASYSDLMRRCTQSLKALLGSPAATRATFLQVGGNLLSSSLRSELSRPEHASARMQLRPESCASVASVGRQDLLSRSGKPKEKSGLSRLWLALGSPSALRPLLRHHSLTCLSLSSTCPGCSSRNLSTKSKTPWSGRATGMTTSGPAGSFGGSGASSWSAFATAAKPRQVKGRAFSCLPSLPKFTARVRPLKVTVGYSALPHRCDGMGCGSPARSPSRKTETVCAFGLSPQRFSSTPTTCSETSSRQAPWRLKGTRWPGSLAM